MSLRELIYSQAKRALDSKSAFLLHTMAPSKTVWDQNVPFQFKRYNPSLLKSISKPPQKYKVDPLLPPFDENLFVTQTKSNNILINKFMHTPGHIVISSKNPNDEQGAEVNSGDFVDIEKILKSFNKGVAYYNCGVESGCTQLHKHLQFAPLEKTPLLDCMKKKMKLPFIYRIEHFQNGSFNAKNIEKAYKQMIRNLPVKSYNFIVNQEVACIIPRIAARDRNLIVINSIGLCGVLTTWPNCDPSIMEKPMRTILDVCVKSE